MARFSAIFYHAQAQDFIEALARTETLFPAPSVEAFTLESAYRAAEIGPKFMDLSFVVLRGDEPVALVLAHCFGDHVGFDGSGAKVYMQDENKKVLVFVLETLAEHARACGAETLKIDDLSCSGVLSALGQECFNRQGRPYSKLRAAQDLRVSEDELHKALRQSYKALVNQGRREITFEYITQENAGRAKFDAFQQFHKHVSGRKTRSDESWDVQFKMIEAGVAELILGYMEPHGLVASALFTDYGEAAAYAVAVYNRDLFDYPLAHASVYEGMLRAKGRGRLRFNLGVIPPYGEVTEKEYNIGKFKKGFCRRLHTFIEWHITL